VVPYKGGKLQTMLFYHEFLNSYIFYHLNYIKLRDIGVTFEEGSKKSLYIPTYRNEIKIFRFQNE